MATTAYPPGPKPAIIGGSLWPLQRDPLTFLTRVAADYGPIAHFKVGPERYFLLSDPHDIEQVLVTHSKQFIKGRGLQRAKRILGEGLLTSEGEFHRRQRRLALPAFHRDRITAYGATMTGLAARDRWRAGEIFDIARAMNELTLAVVAQTLFGADIEQEMAEVRQALTDTLAISRLMMAPFAELLEYLPLPRMLRFRRGIARLDATIYRIIDDRRRVGEDRGDLLSMLLLAQDLEGDGGGMSDVQLRDEAMTIFLAGHETTANALAWTWYLLAEHPDVEAKLHAEIDARLEGRLPGAADLPRLPYARMVLAESMRLYPPAWVVGRRALEDYPAGRYVIPARSIVLMSQYVMHRHPLYFPEPSRFDPDRFLPERQKERPKFAYFPFGGGPRLCLGESFAWMEGILVLATLAQQWRFRLAPGHRVEPQPLITLRPKHGIWVRGERRAR